jgi:tetratricopeptide (TPR) repeat protein
LNAVYNKFKDKGLVSIGQDCWENDDKLVEPFVKSMGDNMTYRVALDDNSDGTRGKMAETWMAAAGRNGIPSAFLIDSKGIIAWIGHPMAMKEDMIEQVLAGKFDIKKAAADYDLETKEEAERERELAPMQTQIVAMRKAMKDKNWKEAMDDLAAAVKAAPEKHPATLGITFNVDRFRILLGEKDYASAYKLAEKMGDENKDNAELLNYLAWAMVSDKTIEKPNLDLAKTLADRANEVDKWQNYELLDTEARVLFMKGQKDEAVQMETKALTLADPGNKQAMQDSLNSYKRGELPAVN